MATDRIFVIVAGVSDHDYWKDQLRLSLTHFVENITDEQIEKGIIEFPDGDGEIRLLPARVSW